VSSGVEVLVDGSADDDDDVLGPRDRTWIACDLERAALQHALQDFGRTRLLEGHAALPHERDHLGVDVVEGDAQPAVGQADAEG
jgi:hypothetical protein